jgi:hypothetical protein
MNNLKIVHRHMQSVNSAFISKRCVVPELTSSPCGRHREKLHWVVYACSLYQVEFRWIPRRSINRPSRHAIKCVAPVPFFVVYPEWIGRRRGKGSTTRERTSRVPGEAPSRGDHRRTMSTSKSHAAMGDKADGPLTRRPPYVVRRASTIFIRAALTAGKTPPTKPITTANVRALYAMSNVSAKLKASSENV